MVTVFLIFFYIWILGSENFFGKKIEDFFFKLLKQRLNIEVNP